MPQTPPGILCRNEQIHRIGWYQPNST